MSTETKVVVLEMQSLRRPCRNWVRQNCFYFIRPLNDLLHGVFMSQNEGVSGSTLFGEEWIKL